MYYESIILKVLKKQQSFILTRFIFRILFGKEKQHDHVQKKISISEILEDLFHKCYKSLEEDERKFSFNQFVSLRRISCRYIYSGFVPQILKVLPYLFNTKKLLLNK